MRALGLHDDEGTTTGEYVAVVLVVAAVVIAGTVAGPADSMRNAILAGFCRLVPDQAFECGSTDVTGPETLDPEEYIPESCDLVTTEYAGSIEVSALIFDGSKGLLFARTDRSDGTTTFTLVDDGSLGVSAEVGAEAHGGVASAEVTAEAKASLNAELGSTWVMDTDDANDFQGQLLEEAAEDAVADSMPLFGPVVNWLADRANGTVRDPDITYVAGGVDASAEAKAEVSVLGEQVGGANVGLEGAILLGREEDRTEGREDEWSDTSYYEVSLAVTGEVGLLTAKASGEMGVSQVMKVTRDLDGNLVEVELGETVTNASMVAVGDITTDNLLRSADETSVVQTTTVTVRSDDDREALEDWLDGESSAAVEDLFSNRSQVSVMEYNGDEFGLSLGGKVALGVKVGLIGDIEHLDNQLVDAAYYGAPDDDGVRRPVALTDCIPAGSGSW